MSRPSSRYGISVHLNKFRTYASMIETYLDPSTVRRLLALMIVDNERDGEPKDEGTDNESSSTKNNHIPHND